MTSARVPLEPAADETRRSHRVRRFTTDPAVPSAIIGNPPCSVLGASFTRAGGKQLPKAPSGYDNQWGYSNPVCDVVEHLATLDA